MVLLESQYVVVVSLVAMRNGNGSIQEWNQGWEWIYPGIGVESGMGMSLSRNGSGIRDGNGFIQEWECVIHPGPYRCNQLS